MPTDLATESGPISNLFPRLSAPADEARYCLTAEQVAFFHENGYLAGVRILDDRQIAALRQELADVMDPKHPGHALFYEFHTNESADPSRVLFHALGHWRITPGFHDLLWHPALTVPAKQLLGGSVRFWHDQLFVKPARHGGVVAWHQDYSYWTRTQPLAHLTCWIGLDDSTLANGCVRYVPGSHRWPLLPMPALAGDLEGLNAFLTPEQRAAFQPVPVELKAGEASFHHPLTVHGSFKNDTDQPRRGAVVNLFKDGVCSASDEPLLKGVPPIPRGQKMEGPFFPLLLP